MRAALKGLPPEYSAKLSNVEFVLARRPTRPERELMGLRSRTLYGLYQGVPLPGRGSWYGMVPPYKITIYWEPLARDFPGEADLAEQVRRTVYHEIAHHFGISDAELRRTSVE